VRLADVISETPEGDLLLDLRRFHHLEPTEPTRDFPYGGTAPAGEGPAPHRSAP
jgi:hypothetical protein